MLLDNSGGGCEHTVAIRGSGPLANALNERAANMAVIPRMGRAGPLSLVRFAALLRRLHPHVVHIYGGRLEALAARAAGACVVERKNVCRNAYYRPLLNFRWADRLLNRAVDASIVPSMAVKQHFVQRGYPPAKMHVVYNGVEPAPERRQEQLGLLRAHLGVPQDAFLVAFAGRLVPEKGVAFLLNALARSPETACCVIMGDGPIADDLRRQAAGLDLHRRVIFTGYREDVRDVFACADIVAVPSLFDTLANVALEAMAEGKAVIATQVEGMPEVVEHGVTGLIVPPGDADALAGAINLLAASPRQARSLGAEARQRTLARHAPARMARETEEIYRNIVMDAQEREYECHQPHQARALKRHSS